MRFFHRQSRDDRRAAERQAEENAASVEALTRGGITVPARRRLETLQAGRLAFSSGLSVDEFLLGRQIGIQPLAAVSGAAVVAVPDNGTVVRSTEWTSASQALGQCRTLALGRMQQEAALVGADIVVGVRIERRKFDEAEEEEREEESGFAGMVQYTAGGTAVRLAGVSAGQAPVLTNLSGQDTWALLQAGYRPAGLAAASVVWAAYSEFPKSGAKNHELRGVTNALIKARRAVRDQMRSQAAALAAEGVVGVTVEEEQEKGEVEDPEAATLIIFSIHLLGTAIVAFGEAAPAHIVPTVNLRRSPDSVLPNNHSTSSHGEM